MPGNEETTREEEGRFTNLGVLILIKSFSYSSVQAGHSIALLCGFPEREGKFLGRLKNRVTTENRGHFE